MMAAHRFAKVTIERERTDLYMKDKQARTIRISLAAPHNPDLARALSLMPACEGSVHNASRIDRRSTYEAEKAQELVYDWLAHFGRDISTTDLLENPYFAEAYGKNFTKSAITYNLRALRDAGRVACDIRLVKRSEHLPAVRTAFWRALN